MKLCLWCEKELPKGRRKYCSDECSYQYYIHNVAHLWWNNAKKIALERAHNMCEDCGSGRSLEVHHKEKLVNNKSRQNSPLNRQDNLIVLCRDCHEKRHHPYSDGRKEVPKEQLRMMLEIR